jgi:hypothetical protein
VYYKDYIGLLELPAYTDDVHLLGDNIDTLKKNAETLIDSSKKVGLEVYVEKTKYMLVSRHQNAGRHYDIIIIVHRSFENVAQLEYLGTTVTNNYFIQEEINSLKFINSPYFSFKNHFVFRYSWRDRMWWCGRG